MKDLLQFFSGLHLASPPPSLILVDGLERYLPSTCSPQDGSRMAALMLDSASHLGCGLVVSAVSTSEGPDGAFLAVERYFPDRGQLYRHLSADTEGFKISFLSPLHQWNLHIEQDGTLRIRPCVAEGDKSPNGPDIDD